MAMLCSALKRVLDLTLVGTDYIRLVEVVSSEVGFDGIYSLAFVGTSSIIPLARSVMETASGY